MKIKADFVTNSSSSSFVVMGAYIESDMITEEMLEKARVVCKYPDLTMEDFQQYPSEYIEPLMGGPMNTDFDFSTGSSDGWGGPSGMYVGIPYDKMGGDETLNQFKQRIKDGIKESLGFDLEVAHIELCWEDR